MVTEKDKTESRCFDFLLETEMDTNVPADYGLGCIVECNLNEHNVRTWKLKISLGVEFTSGVEGILEAIFLSTPGDWTSDGIVTIFLAMRISTN